MPELIIQRLDRGGYWESYPIYVNRKQLGRIGFGQEVKLDLEPGRYLISIGGLRAADAELWIDLGANRRVLQVEGKALAYKDRQWPKWYQLQFKETIPVRKASSEELGELRYLYRQALARAFGFMAVLLVAAAYLIFLASAEQNNLLYYLAILPSILAPWAYRGVLIAQLRDPN